jgi:hypothetical protein
VTAKWTFVLCDALAKVHPVRDPRPVATATRFQAFLGEPHATTPTATVNEEDSFRHRLRGR